MGGLCKPKGVGGTGFCDLIVFNKAMLAKQIWRIIRYPNSLMARVIKAQYFRSSDIMEAKVGYNPSFVWRSILWSCDLIRKGLCWRVVDGNNISIIFDPWIPGFRSRVNSVTDSTACVAGLISSRGSWNEVAVRQTFSPFEAEAVLDIVLTRSGGEDLRYWHGTPDGLYSVNSGYHLELNGFGLPMSQSSYPHHFW